MAGRTPGPLHLPDGFWARSDVLEALRPRNFTALFGLLSKYAGASQTQIAIAVGMTQGQVSTVMAGTRRLTAIDVVERALDGLNAPDAARAAAGLAPRRPTGPDTWESATREKATGDSVYRRDVLQLGGLTAVGVATAEAGGTGKLSDERLTYALEHPSSVDLVAVARLRQRVEDMNVRYDRAPSTSLLAEAGQCLGQVGLLRTHAPTNRVRRELCVVEAEAATLMGKLVWDASQRRNHATARAYYDQAIEAARRVRDPAAEGLALLRKSFVALYGEKDPKAGLQLAAQTADATNGTSHVLTGLAVLHAAEAYAMLGERSDCEKALGRAESHFGQIMTTDIAIDLYSPTQYGRLAGSCYLFLKDARRAEPILEATANALQDRSKSQAIVLGNLALALIRQRKPDEGAATLHNAIDVVEQTWGGGGLNIAFGAGRELRPWRHVAAVQEVYDRLLALVAAA